MRGFHGRTLGALALTWNPKYREPFQSWTMDTVKHVPFNDLGTAQAAVNENTAAVVVEVVQGEGGVYPIDFEYLRGLRRLCDENGALLVIDNSNGIRTHRALVRIPARRYFAGHHRAR